MKRIVGTAVLAVLAGCGSEGPDAWGSFEAEEVTVSAEVGGPLLQFEAVEGARLPRGAVVGVVDTTQAVLQLVELEAQRAAAQSQTGSASANTGALTAELQLATTELARTERLFAAEAATRQQLDQARGRVAVLREQLDGARAQTTGTRDQTASLDARVAQIRDRIARSRIQNPIAGSVLTSYVRAGEQVQPGQPLYRIADLDSLTLRAYVSGDQLAQVRLGSAATVQFDAGEGELGTRAGVIRWISPEAEFTPTPIQTRDERAELVYAVEVRVANADGVLKIGMPGELVLEDGAETSTASR